MIEDENPWLTHSIKEIYSNPWITLTEHDVTNPGGGKGIYGKVHYKNWAIGILPIDREMNTWLVGQFRYTLNKYSWEIPMGGGPLAVPILESAKRELKEETGLTAQKWTELCTIHTSNSVTDETGVAFLAEELTQGDTEFEESEDLAIKKLPFSEAVAMCDNGVITDSLSVAAIYRLARTMNK